ncbi:hypothetical protein [Enterococcus sp. LJL51]|uniref:hypothetical protein n=1 Tax=Enterococcus sp. LJL51 TaxID=3416656 RepID=UPI003CED928D
MNALSELENLRMEDENMRSFKSIVFELSLFYLLLAVGLPLVYAVTYHLPMMGIFSLEWLFACAAVYPLVLLLSAFRYSYQRLKHGYQRNSH